MITSRAYVAGRNEVDRKRDQQELKDKHRQVALKSYDNGITPLEFMLQVMRDEENDIILRMDAAKSAAPYVHPKLASVEMKHTGVVATVEMSDDELLEMLSGEIPLRQSPRIIEYEDQDLRAEDQDLRAKDQNLGIEDLS